MAIPGNHDGDPEQFCRVFSRPAPIEDIGGVRFLAFIDREEPGFNASRSKADIERIHTTRAGFNDPVVALQHVCLFPPDQEVAPYNYTNAPDIIKALKDAGVILSVSGHHHHGGQDTEEDGVRFVNAPGLCEAPFPLQTITIADGGVETQCHELAMPEELQLVDNHLHTELAYCAENVTVKKRLMPWVSREFVSWPIPCASSVA